MLTAVVRGAADDSLDGTSAILSGLPVAGYDGTLVRPRRRRAPRPGTVRAKTGTLLGVHALAGTVVTADGRLLAFAVVADGSGSDAAAEAALDDVRRRPGRLRLPLSQRGLRSAAYREAMTSASSMVDWDLAGRTARRLIERRARRPPARRPPPSSASCTRRPPSPSRTSRS